MELAYNDGIAQADYSIFFQANERPATKKEQQSFLHAYPDADPSHAHCLQVCTQLHFYLKIGRYVRIIHPQKELTLPPADEITFKIQRDENNHDLFSVLVAVAQSSEFKPSRYLRELEGKGRPIAYRRETNLSMKTPMGSEKIIDFPLTHNQDSESTIN